MNLLGIDYGDKHLGVALATTFVAEALEVIPAHFGLARIKELVIEYQIQGFVLGLSENQMADKTKQFAQILKNNFNLPVYFYDETLSSQDTRRQLAQMGVKRSKRQSKTDHYVAASILQNYLDSATIDENEE